VNFSHDSVRTFEPERTRHARVTIDRLPVTLPTQPADESAAPEIGDNGDRISVTGVNGTVAKFEMTYSPPSGGRAKFGPPLRTRLPSAAYLGAALVLEGVVTYAYAFAPSNSAVFAWIVEGDRGRPVSANILAAIVVISALATVVRTHMRGVLVSDDWIEARYLLPLGIPRARRWVWPQVHRVIVDGPRVAFELWDGSFERLPNVEKAHELADMIQEHAQKRRIGVTVLHPTRV
jgi:hypothetical protein